MLTSTQWSVFGVGQSEPPPKERYREATTKGGRRGRVVREENGALLVSFYTTGEELVQKEDVTVVWRDPNRR